VCGLNAILTEKNSGVPFLILEKMHAQIPHRGPDGEGFLSWAPNRSIEISHHSSQLARGKLLFAHRRLAIQDTLSRSIQPMANADKTLFIIFNGEIYNFIELRQSLEKLGYFFNTNSDTEVLLKAYEIWGKEVLPRLVGMFTFLILDLRKSCLFVARDFFGIKPLYYSYKNGNYFFASELNSLICLDTISRKVHPKALYDYLRFGLTNHSQDTLFADIKQFPAAHYAQLDLQTPRLEPIRYWSPQCSQVNYTRDEAAEKLRTLFLKNIELHLRSDVPVGAALSGGLDSSSIVMGMKIVGGKSLNVKTFSYCARGSNYNEEVWIDRISQASGVENHKTFLAPEVFKTDLETLVKIQGEPFGSTSIYAQYKVFELAKNNNIKVMLDGQGADELLAGYRPYLAKRLGNLLREGQLHKAAQFIIAALKLPDLKIKKFLLQVGAQFIPSALENFARQISGQSLAPSWIEQKWFIDQGLSLNVSGNSNSEKNLKSSLIDSLTSTVLPALLRYEDHNSMNFSIESRVPFLTPEFADFVYSLDDSFLISDTAETKSIFRQAMKRIVPEDILNRRDKIGFKTPEQSLIKEYRDWIGKSSNQEVLRQIPGLNHKVILEQLQQATTKSIELDFKYWRWINLIKWVEIYNVEFSL
jgi:asparagine synthase (glutamine-hydrolysing)